MQRKPDIRPDEIDWDEAKAEITKKEHMMPASVDFSGGARGSFPASLSI